MILEIYVGLLYGVSSFSAMVSLSAMELCVEGLNFLEIIGVFLMKGLPNIMIIKV